MEYHVAEIFKSINGEGQHAGELALFVRFTGCNLNCNYCDTTWANQSDAPYTAMTETEIIERIRQEKVKNVTLTGGEPLQQEGMLALLTGMSEQLPDEIRVEIETNGSVDITPFDEIRRRKPAFRLVFTLDYKMPGSGMEASMNTDNYRMVKKDDTVKFVVSDGTDLGRAREIIEEYHLQGKCGIYLSPVFGRIEPVTIVNDMLEHNLNDVHVQLQLHKFIWDPNERGV